MRGLDMLLQPVLETKVKLSLELPESLHDHYEKTAKGGRNVTEEIQERLKRCKDFSADRPLYFDDEQRSKLERALGVSVKNPDQMVAAIENALRVKVDDVEFVIPEKLKQRLLRRTFRGQTIEDTIKKAVKEGLERAAGLQPW